MNIALMQFFTITGSFKKAVTLSDSAAARQAPEKSDAPPLPPSKRVTEIHSYIKHLKGLQKDIKFHSSA
jgi:hypothetical protein